MNPNEEIRFFTDSDHLTHETIAMCAEKMIDLRLHKNLPEEVFEHLQACVACGNHVAGLYSTISSRPEIVREITKNLEKEKFTKPHRFLRKPAFQLIAASVVVLISVFTASYFFLKPKGNEALFQQHFYAYQNILTTKSSSNSDLMRAMLYYDLKDYENSKALFEKVLATDPGNYTAMFYLANACLASEDNEYAISLLERCITADYQLSEAARWYLSLANLRIGESEKARDLLQSLKAGDGFYGMKAAEILRKLPGE